MLNLASTEKVISGRIYMVDLDDGECHSLRVLSETPTHYIFSFSSEESVDVFPKKKSDVKGIYEVNEWWKENGDEE